MFGEVQWWVPTPPTSTLPPPLCPSPLSLSSSASCSLINIDKVWLLKLKILWRLKIIYVKFLYKLQTLLSEIAGQCWPHYENGLKVLAMYTDVNKEASMSSPALQGAPAVVARERNKPFCYLTKTTMFDSKQQSPINKNTTSVHVLYKSFALKKSLLF